MNFYFIPAATTMLSPLLTLATLMSSAHFLVIVTLVPLSASATFVFMHNTHTSSSITLQCNFTYLPTNYFRWSKSCSSPQCCDLQLSKMTFHCCVRVHRCSVGYSWRHHTAPQREEGEQLRQGVKTAGCEQQVFRCRHWQL